MAPGHGCTGGGNFAGVTTWAWSRGRMGENGPDKRASSISEDFERKAGRARTRRWAETLQ
jgi:hypothetical protein